MFPNRFYTSFLINACAVLCLTFLPLASVSCSTLSLAPTSEADAFESLRRLAQNGNLPSEAAVAGIEARFPNSRTAALARLLRAHILLENGDALNAAGLLQTNIIRDKSALGDYALWLGGKAYSQAGRTTDAATTYEKLLRDFPDSLRAREAKLSLATIRKQSNEPQRVASVLSDLTERNDAEALLLLAQTHEAANDTTAAIAVYRRLRFYAPGAPQAAQAEAGLTKLGASLEPANADEAVAHAANLFRAKRFNDAATAYGTAFTNFPISATSQNQLQRGIAFANLKRAPEAAGALNAIPLSAGEIKAQALAELAKMYANVRQWQQARQTTSELQRGFNNNEITAKTLVAVGAIAREAKNKFEEQYFLSTALRAYPNSPDVGKAQFELAWIEHEADNYARSSQQLVEHLARYAAKDTTYRGRAGYWAARDSERAGKIVDACALYNGVLARYDANWYGYLAKQRLDALNRNRSCSASNQPTNLEVTQAVANLKTITVASETATERELLFAKRGEELAIIGLFDLALEELDEAAETAPNSPKVNLALANLHRYKGDNVTALLSLAKSYPDYSQMKPEELSREEWDIFYPLTNWQTIKQWANARQLDPYQVAGLIRQESVFNPRAKSRANAFGLMQLLVPTARMMARKYGSQASVTADALYNPALNIELGTAYIREQFDNFGRIEYVAAAYNAGPGRVPGWRASLPLEIDEFAEGIPFKETRGYVQGVVRNTAQYRRLYDDNGQFRANVGTKRVRAMIDALPPEQLAQELPDVVVAANGE